MDNGSYSESREEAVGTGCATSAGYPATPKYLAPAMELYCCSAQGPMRLLQPATTCFLNTWFDGRRAIADDMKLGPAYSA